VRPSGNNANGGGYDSGISGAATDYSQQDAAQATGTNGAGSASTTFTDTTANAFTAAMVGNCIYIAGQGFYFVVTYTDAGHVVVDRALGTFSGASWKLGGGWADFWTNTAAAATFPAPVPGNTIYILGSGTPNPSSYTYDYVMTAAFTPVVGSIVTGFITFTNDPATPGYRAPPDTTGGMPCIQCFATDGIYLQCHKFIGLWFVASSAAGPGLFLTNTAHFCHFFGNVFDQLGYDIWCIGGAKYCAIYACEFFSSVAFRGFVNGSAAISATPLTGGVVICGCNIHDMGYNGIYGRNGSITIINNIIAKCAANGIDLYISSDFPPFVIQNNTIDANGFDGVHVSAGASTVSSNMVIMNNIITNHPVYVGLEIDSYAAPLGDITKGFMDFNVFYNNATDVLGLNYGPHDTHGGSDPYVNQSTQNYSLA
jgi:hypothetical protein